MKSEHGSLDGRQESPPSVDGASPAHRNAAKTAIAHPPSAAGIPPHEPASRPTRANLRSVAPRGASLWLGGYRLFLFVLIVSYYTLIIFIGAELGSFSFRVLPSGPVSIVAGASQLGMAVATIVLAGVLLLHVVGGFYGLVTSVHDQDSDVVDGVPLEKESHPDLFAAVSDVAARVASPAPDEIRVTERAEVYVAESREFAVRTARRLTLVVGLPHLAVLTTTELKVILAHELAHLRQGDTSLAVFIFRFLESLRAYLEKCSTRPWRWASPLFLYSFAYFRLFLWLASPIRRHQELFADRLSAVAYGGKLAARTLVKEWLLARQFDAAVASYDVAGGSREDDGNVFLWFRRNWREFSPQGQDYLLARLAQEERPAYSDSHPAMCKRVAAMKAYPPVEPPDGAPASTLLPDLAALEKQLHGRVFAG